MQSSRMQPDPGSFSLMFLFYLTHWLYARYLLHLSGYNKIAQVAPTWAKNFVDILKYKDFSAILTMIWVTYIILSVT